MSITIRVTQISLPLGYTQELFEKKALKAAGIKTQDAEKTVLLRRSLDARHKDNIHYVCSADITLKDGVKPHVRGKNIKKAGNDIYRMPKAGKEAQGSRIAVIGDGPAGLFCAYVLSHAGLCPVVFERGKIVSERFSDVERFWRDGTLDPQSNVQFGEGGAGTFSDGKLNTLVNDRSGRNRFVLETFVRFGAPSDILFDAKPHIGTDILCDIVENMRRDIIAAGGEFYFSSTVTDLIAKDGALCALIINQEKTKSFDRAVLALGHSSRDTFIRLKELGISLSPKPFSVGLRAEHPQSMIDISQYGKEGCDLGISPASYKLSHQSRSKRGVYTFCMCPGGYVVNASSEPGRLAVNGMSLSKRDGKNANSAVCVSIDPEDIGPSDDPLKGMYFQRKLEKKAYELGRGMIPQQLYGDFLRNVNSTSYGGYSSQTKGASSFVNLNELFPLQFCEAFTEGMTAFGGKIPGFDREDCILSGVESRTSSPVRIIRREDMMSPSMRGLYPCGEGAGYAGGIMSAAMDGMKTAEALIRDCSGI